jgi:putative ABC transport system permease protein
MLSDLRFRLRALFRRPSMERELDEELRAHLQRQVDRHRQSGLTLEEAQRRARLEFGGLEQVKEDCRDARGVGFLVSLLQDVRFSLRILRKTPTVTAVALLSLALGIGANAGIFSLINTVMLRALPVQRPEELAQIKFHSPGSPDMRRTFTNPIWEQVRDHQDALSGVFAWSPTTFDLANGGEVRRIHGIYASGGYFETLGVQAAAGRLLTPEDDRRGCAGAAVLGYSFWQERYAGAESAIGSLIRLDGHEFPVIGVTGPGFFGTDVGDRFDVAIPVCAEAVIRGGDSSLDRRSSWWLLVMGRLKEPGSFEQTTARLNTIAAAVFEASVPTNWPADSQKSFRQFLLASLPAATGATGFSNLRGQYQRPLNVLMGVVAFVLLIACANIAGLMSARGAARRGELALRQALGASRRRLVRQLLTECILLSSAGALLGLCLARWGAALLARHLARSGQLSYLDLSLDGRVLAFTAALTILTAILFGAWPAVRSTRVSLAPAMKGNVTDDEKSGSRFRAGKWMVALQVALSLVLLVGAGLFLRTFEQLITLDTGFDRGNVLLVNVNLATGGIPAERRTATYDAIQERLDAIPGVVSVGRSWNTPLSQMEWNNLIKADAPGAPTGDASLAYFNYISPQYFPTLRMKLLAGRNFATQDTATSPPVAIVNQTLARKFFPNLDPIGRTFQISDSSGKFPNPPFEIVGLVKDSKYESLREDTFATAFFPIHQMQENDQQESFELRTAIPPSILGPGIAAAVTGVNRSIPVEIQSLAGRIDDALVQERILAVLSGFLGALALLLTAIGLYGVLAYSVARRTHEIGVRVALGADRGTILALIMRDAGILIGAGVAAGGMTAFWLSQFVEGLLFGVRPGDATTLGLAAATLVIVAFVAAYLPARRAMRIDPMTALRYE